MHQRYDACTQLTSSNAQGVGVAGSLEVKAQIVKTGKGSHEMPALRHYKHEKQPEEKHVREAQEQS